jgi:hypothetical protein
LTGTIHCRTSTSGKRQQGQDGLNASRRPGWGRPGQAAGLRTHPDCAAAWPTAGPRHRRAHLPGAAVRVTGPGPVPPGLSVRDRDACPACRAAGRFAAIAAGQQLPGAATSAVALMPAMMIRARRPGLAAGEAAPLIAVTSPTRAGRQPPSRAAAGPSCQRSCRRRIPGCTSRMSRPLGRRPRPAAGSWSSDALQSVSYR